MSKAAPEQPSEMLSHPDDANGSHHLSSLVIMIRLTLQPSQNENSGKLIP